MIAFLNKVFYSSFDIRTPTIANVVTGKEQKRAAVKITSFVWIAYTGLYALAIIENSRVVANG